MAHVVVVGGVITWILAIPSAVVFAYGLLHGVRVLWQFALVFCLGSLFFAPAARGPLWLAGFALLGLIFLLLPASREFCIANHASERADG